MNLKYPRTPYAPYSPSIAKEDRVYANINHFLGKRIIITEKIDGSNTTLYQGKPYARGIGDTSRHKIHGLVKKHHAWKVQGGDILYGEDIYAVHSIEYDPVYENETFMAFALRQGDVLRSWDALVKYTDERDIPRVPLIFDGYVISEKVLKELFLDVFRQGSSLGPEVEGAVLRTADGFPIDEMELNICKVTRRNHVQTDEHWSENWQTCELKERI